MKEDGRLFETLFMLLLADRACAARFAGVTEMDPVREWPRPCPTLEREKERECRLSTEALLFRAASLTNDAMPPSGMEARIDTACAGWETDDGGIGAVEFVSSDWRLACSI